MDQIKGLYYIKNYLSEDEINNLTSLIINETWQSVGPSNRSRQSAQYGYIYNYDRSGISKTNEMPDYYKNLMNKDRINSILGFPLLKEDFDQLIINKYDHQGITKHVDHVKYFGPIIACLTTGDERPIRFSNGRESIDLLTEIGSLYIMTDDARYKYTHSLAPMNNFLNTRYSFTFRKIKI